MKIPIPFVAVAFISLAGCTRSSPPYSPKQALKTFQIESGFRIETYATEPDIRSPVAMEIDEKGRIYVVEDPGYPLNTEGKVGRIILLEDTDGDGRPDRRSVFADKLTLPTGVMRWRKGILVTDAPDVLYFEDSDGDGKADIRRVILTGFAASNPQHTVNSPVYGLDNWIYLAHEGPAGAVIFADKFGDRGSDLRFPGHEIPSLKPARRMVRFRPDTYELEYLASSSQFGHSFDSWGHHFTVGNEDHIREEVMAARYFNRNSYLPAGASMERISDHRAAADVFPIARNPRVEMLSGVGSFTSACGITLYLGGAFPKSSLFALVAEPAQNLVHRDILAASGAVYTASRAQKGVEFLASTDAWFRPVNFYIGPDAAIYLVDYYRQVIEHPEWMATHTHKSKELYQGEDRGRIYRIVPETSLPLPAKIRLDQASDEELVLRLASSNIWWRRTAQRLLIDRQSARAVEPLTKLFDTSPSAVARLHALWTLDGLHKLEPALIEKALADPEAGVRENAILLAETRLTSNPDLVEKLLKMDRDPDLRVKFQLLCTLGGAISPGSRSVQDHLLAENIEDPWMQIAALSASPDRAPQLFKAAGAFTAKESAARSTFFRQVSAVIGATHNPAEIRRVLETLVRASKPDSSWWRAAPLGGLALGLGGGQSLSGRANAVPGERHAPANLGQDLLLKLFDSADDNVRRAALRVLAATGLPPNAKVLTQRATVTAADDQAGPAPRADAIGLLGLDDPAAHAALFKKLIDPQQPEPVQAAAVHALGLAKGPEAGMFLVERWRTMTPAVRSEAADAMFVDDTRPRLLVKAIQDDLVQPWTLAFRHKVRLVMSRDPSIRDAARLLLEEKAGEREKVLERYGSALAIDGDAGRGQQVFERVCAKCHMLKGVGHEVGPDLATITNRPANVILADIIMPNRSIAQNYESYVIETKSSGMIEGVLGSQTPTTITIRHEEGKQDVIRRDDIKEMRTTNLSAMPEDVDKQVSVEQMTDLLKFLKTTP